MDIQNSPKINFGAIPRASYKLPSGENVRILEMEARDLPFITKLSDNMDEFMTKREIETVTDKRLIIDTAFKIIKEMLNKPTKPTPNQPKTHLFIAECDSDICGVLVGGLPKKTPKRDLRHSSRGGAKRSETELNWLATWTPSANTKRKGVGKILMSEYIDTFKQDGVKKAFIQSEIPSLSFAQKFYESLGFKALSEQKPHSQIEKNKDIVGCVEDLYDYDIVPMLGKTEDVNKVKKEIFHQYNRTPLKHESVDISENLSSVLP